MKRKAPTLTLRSRIEAVDGPVLELARQDALFPVADALLPKEDGANEEEEKPRSRKPADLGDAPVKN